MDAKSDLIWAIVIIIILAIIWFVTGGPLKPGATSGPFLLSPIENAKKINPLYNTNLGSGNNSNTSSNTNNGNSGNNVPTNGYQSPYANKIKLSRPYYSSDTDANKEYLTINANSNLKEPVVVTGWRLKNKNNFIVTIPSGTKLPHPYQANSTGAIVLEPEGSVVVNSGRGTFGLNFLINKCTGYLKTTDTPNTYSSCPNPLNDPRANGLSNKCLDYLDNISQCSIPSVPISLTDDTTCRNYIAAHYGYDQCIADNQSKENFYGKEWRVFLNNGTRLWQNRREIITLYDSSGLVVDEVSF